MNEEAMRQAIEMARKGYKVEAGQIFQQIVRVDSNNDLGWAWLAAVTSHPEKKRDYLQRAVELNPNNIKAQRALDELEFILESPMASQPGSAPASQAAFASYTSTAPGPPSPPAEASTASSAPVPSPALAPKPATPAERRAARKRERDALEDAKSGGVSPWVWVFGGLVALCILCMVVAAVASNIVRNTVEDQFTSQVTLGPGEHTIIYRVKGSGGKADVTYSNARGQSVQKTVNLPWAVQFKAPSGSFLTLTAISSSGGDVSCLIEGDGVTLQDDSSSNGMAMCMTILQ